VSLHHLALRVADPVRSARFYTAALGLAVVAEHAGEDGAARSVWLALGDAVLMLERAIKLEGGEGSGHVLVVGADDLAAAEARLRDAGATVLERTAATLYFRDPDGHRVGVSVFRFAGR
jgi:catechol 2,3-dioxygenase-like lactoylglutathione lyase family enzyme